MNPVAKTNCTGDIIPITLWSVPFSLGLRRRKGTMIAARGITRCTPYRISALSLPASTCATQLRLTASLTRICLVVRNRKGFCGSTAGSQTGLWNSAGIVGAQGEARKDSDTGQPHNSQLIREHGEEGATELRHVPTARPSQVPERLTEPMGSGGERTGKFVGSNRSQGVEIGASHMVSAGQPERVPGPPALGKQAQTHTGVAGPGEEMVPWFLRVQTPKLASHPLANRQELPPLPEDPPPALESLLNQLAIGEGIMDLRILDLRPLDPAPALGENTMMIIGTARSDRQLHTSADRICRWLRKEHGMAPFADGLVGRNEARIQERRQRRRGKLNSAQTGIEAGIGWICITAGSQGLVVQLFTARKRDDIDLESLWTRELDRDAKRKETERKVAGGEPKYAGAFARGLPTRISLPQHQVRFFRSSTRGKSMVLNRIVTSRAITRRMHYEICWKCTLGQPCPTPAQCPRNGSKPSFASIRLKVDTHIRKGHFWRILAHVPETFGPDKDLQDAGILMAAHVNHLRIQYRGNNFTGKLTAGCKKLGLGPDDHSSTPFLQSYFRSIPKSPSPIHFQLHLQFLIEANRISPWKYPLTSLADFIKQLSGPIPTEIYYLALRAIADSPELRTAKRPYPLDAEQRLALMQDLIDHYSSTGATEPAKIPEFRLCRFRALAENDLDHVLLVAKTIASMSRAEAGKDACGVIQKFTLRVGDYALDPRILDIEGEATGQMDQPYALREHQEMAMATFAMTNHWAIFWNRWKSLNYMGARRDQGFYELAIGLVVMAGKQKEAVYAARHLWNDIQREVPRVALTAGLARGFLALVELAERGTGEGGEFVPLKKRCGSYWEAWARDREEAWAKAREEAELAQGSKAAQGGEVVQGGNEVTT